MNWTNDKPVFTEDCVLVTADKLREGVWDYYVWEIKWSIENNYWQWLDGLGDEQGDIDDLAADKYLILPKH